MLPLWYKFAKDPHCKFAMSAAAKGTVVSALQGPVMPDAATTWDDSKSWAENRGLFVNTNYTFNGDVAEPAEYGTNSRLYTKFDMHGWSTDFTLIGTWDFPTGATSGRYQLEQNGSTTAGYRAPYLSYLWYTATSSRAEGFGISMSFSDDNASTNVLATMYGLHL